MTMTSYTSSRKASASQLATWLNEAHQWHRIADDRRLSQSKLDQARENVDRLIAKILEANPHHGAAMRLKYRSELAIGRFKDALGTLQELTRREPYSVEIWHSLGETALKCQQAELAESAFNRVLELQKDRADAYCGIAQARLHGGDYVGAWLRASSLYQKEYRNSAVYQVIEHCAGRLKCDTYDEATETLLLELLQDSQLNPECLSNMVASLIRQKYDLDNPEALIDIAACSQDSLLINGLLLTSLQDEAAETLVTLLRQHIFLTACASGDLDESFQTLIIALGVHAQRSDYIAPVTADEQSIVESLNHHIEQSLAEGGTPEELVGALLLISLYRPLYTERYSFRLLRWDLEEWPSRTQGVFKLNLYDYANEHALRHELCLSVQERESELLSLNGKTAFPKWSLPELVQEWRDLEGQLPELERMSEPQILVLGCGSGKRAIALAQFYPQAQILAIDDNAYDLAYASRQASEIGCDNIEFVLGDWTSQLPNEAYGFDLIECAAYLPKAPTLSWFQQLKRLSQSNAVIRLIDNRMTLPKVATNQAIPLPHTEAFQSWRLKWLQSESLSTASLTRQALFNREGARRMLPPAGQTSVDLGEILMSQGLTADASRAKDGLTLIFDSGRRVLAS